MSVLALNAPLISCFLDEVSNLPNSIVFLCFFYIVHFIRLLISPYYSLELCIQLGIYFPSSLAFCFSSLLSYL